MRTTGFPLTNWHHLSSIADSLNRADSRDVRKRLSDLIETTKKLLTLKTKSQKQRGRLTRNEARDFNEYLEHVNNLLSEFPPAYLHLDYLNPVGLTKDGRIRSHHGTAGFEWRFKDSSRWEECRILVATQAIAKRGELHRLRRCELESCHSWFYARSRLKRFCSQECKQRKKSSSPTFKKKRAKYMREYYHKFLKKGAVWQKKEDMGFKDVRTASSRPATRTPLASGARKTPGLRIMEKRIASDSNS
jgi:hypothetical protein